MEALGDEVMGTEKVKKTGGTEASVVKVDEGGESEVVVEEVKKGSRRKCAPLLPPKLSRKRAHAVMATQMSVGSQSKAESVGGMGISCKWCICQGVGGMVTDAGARCENCKAKYYRCLLVPAREGSGGKGSLSRLQHTMVSERSQKKWQTKQGKGAKGVSPSSITLGKLVWLSLSACD